MTGPQVQAPGGWLARVLDAQAATADQHGDAARIAEWRDRAADRAVRRVSS